MKRWIKKLESVFVSVAFAEMGEHDKARNMLGTMSVNPKKCLSINGHFVQYLRYARKLILGISTICLWLIFSHALILNKISHSWIDTKKLWEDVFISVTFAEAG